MLETTAHAGEDLMPAGPWAASACAAQCQGLGAAVGTTPQLLHLLCRASSQEWHQGQEIQLMLEQSSNYSRY